MTDLTRFRIKLGAAFLLGAGAIVLAVMTLGPRPDPRLAGLSFEERAFCSDQASLIGGAELMTDMGAHWLGWQLEPTDDGGLAPSDVSDVALSCRIAYLLYGVSPAEWSWCGTQANRERFLAPAVEALGLGEETPESADGWWNVADDSIEERFACRFAYNYWREAGVSAITDARSHPFLRLSAAETAWCGQPAHRAVLEWVAGELGIETPETAAEAQQVTAYVRACRLAAMLGTDSVEPPTDHVRDGASVFSDDAAASAERELSALQGATGLVGVFITQDAGEIVNWFPELDHRRKIVLTYEAHMVDGCCAFLGSTGSEPNLDPVLDAMNDGDFESGLREFVSMVRGLAGDPSDQPRRLPEDPFLAR